jgi:hypothetical protein
MSPAVSLIVSLPLIFSLVGGVCTRALPIEKRLNRSV